MCERERERVRAGKEKGRTSAEKAQHRKLISSRETGKPVYQAIKVRLNPVYDDGAAILCA